MNYDPIEKRVDYTYTKEINGEQYRININNIIDSYLGNKNLRKFDLTIEPLNENSNSKRVSLDNLLINLKRSSSDNLFRMMNKELLKKGEKPLNHSKVDKIVTSVYALVSSYKPQ